MAQPSQPFIENELQLALQSYRAGDLGSAEKRIDSLLAAHPRRADVLLSKGVIQIARGNRAGGLESLHRSLAIEPNSGEALAWAARASLGLGRFQEAEGLAVRFARIDPQNARAHFLQATALMGLDRIQDAIQAIDRALALKPDDAESLVLKARLLKRWKLPALAIEFYRRALALGPAPGAAIEYAQILLRENNPEEALTVLESTLPVLPENLRPYDLIGQANTELQRFEEADANWSLAEKYCRDRTELFQRHAAAEIAIGRFERAESLLAEVMDDSAGASHTFFLLSMGRKMRQDDLPLIDRMTTLLDSGELAAPAVAEMNYALGKAFDDLKDYERAIGHYDEANRVTFDIHSKESKARYSAEDTRAFTDSHIAYFTKDKIQELKRYGLGSSLPLFVLGMPRSGTTLTAHILNAHSKVRGGGEYSFWPERWIEFMGWHDGQVDLKFDLVTQFADDYLKMLEPGEPGVLHVIDKNPMNYQSVAVLHCCFPDAKIIHLKRHPVDNLLSMWMIRFGGDGRFLSNRENLVTNYREHVRLLKHYKEVLPEDRFHVVRYEDLTSEPETTIREMLSFLELEEEQACFEPENNPRAIMTPSTQQARQPIHRGSQARWKNYEPWLGAFAELLDDPECL